MTKVKQSGTDESRKSMRPVLIASRNTVRAFTNCLQGLLVGLADESITTALVCPPNCTLGGMAPIPADIFTHPPIDWPILERLGTEDLAGHLERFRPTVLHCLCESRAALACRLAQRLDIPYIQTVNSLMPKAPKLSISSTHCTHMLMPAGTILSSAAKTYFRYADRMKQIHLGTFAGNGPICFSDPLRLGCVMVVHPLQQVEHFNGLFEAVRTLLDEGHEFMMVIMGSGRAEGAIRKRLADCGLSEVVTIVPPLEPWRPVLATADILVQPQPNTAFNAVLLEALGLGLAVVACAGGVDDLVVPGQTALVMEPGNEQSIYDNLARLLGDVDYARRLAGMAQSYVGGRHSVGGMVSAMLETYAEAQRQYGQTTH